MAEAKVERHRPQAAAELPTDVLANILSRLTVRTLSRFRCVSNQWRSLISDSWFVNLHRRKSSQNLNFVHIHHEQDEEDSSHGCFRFTCTDSKGKVFQEFTARGQIYDDDYVTHVYNHNDLICFTTSCVSEMSIYICNPATCKLQILPRYSPVAKFCVEEILATGFAYLSSKNEYKVMRFIPHSPSRREICEIFSFRAGANPCYSSWRVIDEKCPLPVRGASVFVKGCLHWPASGYERFGLIDTIVSFDLMSENFRTFPPPIEKNKYGISLHQLEGMLSLADYCASMMLDLWVLRDYEKGKWIKLCTVDFRPACGIHFYIGLVEMVNGELLIVPEEEVYDWERKIHFYYNIENKEFRIVDVPVKHGGKVGLWWESMVPVGRL